MGKKLVEFYDKKQEFKEKYSKKLAFYSQKWLRIRNKLGRARLFIILRALKPKSKSLIFFLGNISFEGIIYYVVYSGFANPFNITHRILSLGLTPWVLSKWTGRLWSAYVSGKIEINNGTKMVTEEEEQNNVMEY